MNTRWILVAGVSLTLAACTGAADDQATDSPEPTSTTPSVSTEAPVPSETPSPEPTVAAEASFGDLNGRWCPASPTVTGEVCVDIALPALVFDGSATEEYTYLPGKSTDTDPRTYAPEDFLLAPTVGECWDMAIDGFPGTSGAWLTYCPAGAVSGEQWIDDPWNYFPDEWGVDPAEIGDYRDQDRLYMGQEYTYYPYVREDASAS